MEVVYQRLVKMREGLVWYWDKKCAHRMQGALRKGDWVLLYNKSLESQCGGLFSNRWNGLY